MKKIFQTACLLVFIMTVFYLPALAEENLTVETLLASPDKYLDKTVHVVGYMANVADYGSNFGFALYNKKTPGMPAYPKPIAGVNVVGVNANRLRRENLSEFFKLKGRLFIIWESIRNNEEEGLVTVNGVLRKTGKDYEIEISEFPNIVKSNEKNIRTQKTISELAKAEKMSRMGKMVSKDSSFIKEYYQDESGKIWYREDWSGKEFTATGVSFPIR